MPISSPTSLPALSGECTQHPTSSRSGCSSTPLIAATPTPPVAHCTTRRPMSSSQDRETRTRSTQVYTTERAWAGHNCGDGREGCRVRRAGTAADLRRRRVGAAGHAQAAGGARHAGDQPQPPGRDRRVDRSGVGAVPAAGSARQPAFLCVQPPQAARRHRRRLPHRIGQRATRVPVDRARKRL